MSRRVRMTVAGAVAGLLTLAVASIAPGSAHASPAPATVAAATPTATDDSWSHTDQLTRTFGNGKADDVRSVTVTADKHTNLQDHERIDIRWKGAHPTGGRSVNPFGENGLDQEYPVVVMECRGVDPQNGTPAAGQDAAAPDTCWTNTNIERSGHAEPGTGIWQLDADATDDDKAHISGIDPSQIPSTCNVTDAFDYHITPFVAADGKVFPGCDLQSMPPEATAASVSIPNEVFAFTNTQGEGNVQFEVRTDVENESLGCSETVACTIEVIPVDGINCAPDDTSDVCNSTGVLPSGQLNTSGVAAAPAVSGDYWWSPSNWSRRFSIPVTFAPPPSVCSISTTAGTPVPFYGSELLSQAALQWTPAYCLNKSRFNWQDNIMADDAAFQLMDNGQAAAALVSGPRDGNNIGYAPTAVTGWGIAFDIDKPNNAGQQMTLHLDARLLAKLLTESYPGGPTVRAAHPGLASNPMSLNLDPEFISLNPGLDTRLYGEAQATLLALSTSSDIIKQITSYIASDKSAMAFIHGKPDPWGMKVNPFYKNMTLPVSTWPLLDTWINKYSGNGCLATAPTAYMPLIAAPVSSFRLIATDMLYNWPNVATTCNGAGTAQDPYQLGRGTPQGLGSRMMLGVVTLADAKRYGLTVASLETAKGHYVAPTEAGMAAAIKLAKPAGPMAPVTISEDAIRSGKDAYPGTMVVYTAAKTTGLGTDDAKDVAQFIRVSTTEGQRPGRGNGQLPDGYLPIEKTGPTASLYAQAQRVAAAVEAQKAPATPPTTTPSTSPTPPAGGTTDGSTPPAGTTPPGDAPGGSTPSTSPAPSSSPSTTTTSEATVATAAVTSSVGGALLPLLLVLGVLAGVGTAFGRIWLRLKGLK